MKSALVIGAVSTMLMLPICAAGADNAAHPPDVKAGPVEKRSMVLVKGGCFDMGDIFGDGRADEKPVHEVCVNDFYIGRHEVSVDEFREFVSDTGFKTKAETEGGCYFLTSKASVAEKRYWADPGYDQTEAYPAVCITWNEVYRYIEWLNEKTGRKYRLPTEAEWEYAARSAGRKYKYSWGNGRPSGNIGDESLKREIERLSIKWVMPTWVGYDDGYSYAAPVETFAPNEIGLYDMTGNVWEWIHDWYDEKYYKKSPKNNPEGPEAGKARVIRGGSWLRDQLKTRSTYRTKLFPDIRDAGVGFRLALSPEPFCKTLDKGDIFIN